MVSFIIESKNPELGLKEITKICAEKNIAPVDQITISLETNEKSALSIGIQEIKKLQQKVYLKPLQSQEKAIIIQNAETLTTEAQNALLKILEEPPVNTYIYIVTKDSRVLLPTILSRCSRIDIVQNDEKDALHEELHSVFQKDIQTLSGKLAVAEKYGKQKLLAITFLEQLLNYYHEQLHQQEPRRQTVHAIQAIQESLRILQTTNVNPRLALEHALFLLKS